MKKIIFGILFFTVFETYGQSLNRSVVASGGSYTQAGGFSISSTVGEIAVTTLSGVSSILTQGFQQPDGLFVGIVDPATGTLSLQAFPNPVSTELSLEISSPENKDLFISVHDMLGRTVLPGITQRVQGGETVHVQIHVQQLSPAMYFIRIARKSDSQILETLRIIKSH